MKKIGILLACLFITGNILGKSVGGTITKTDTAKYVITTIDWMEEFLGGDATSGNIGDMGWASEVNGTGAAVGITVGEATRPGQYSLSSGTTNTGRVSLFPQVTNPAYGCLRADANGVFECGFAIGALSTAGEEFTLRFGLLDVTNAVAVDGVWFEYTRTTDVNWLMCTANASSVTATPSANVVASGYTKLKFRISASQDTVEYYVNNVSIGKVITNIPSDYTSIMIQFLKTAGTTATYLTMDYVRWHTSFAR